MDEVLSADAILVLGCLRTNNPVLRYKLSQASKRGASIFFINAAEDGMNRIGDEFTTEYDDLDFLGEITKYVLENRKAADTPDGLEALKDSLAALEISEESEMIGNALVNAKHPMVILGGKYITEEASALADIAVLLGKSDGPRRGVFRVEQKITAKRSAC